jgi:chitinase
LLTAAIAWQPSLIASIQGQFDQINLMTYDLSGPWEGWVTWFNSPIYDGGYRFPSTGALVPSVDGMVRQFVDAGVNSGKLGIGMAFYGYVWSGGAGTPTGGATLPRQSWTTAPASVAVGYKDIMSTYYQSNLYHWDSPAQAAYLSVDESGSANDEFISYDDAHTCQAKVSYARNQHLGGVMIWELGDGYRATQPAGQRDLLLQSIKQTLATPGALTLQRDNASALLSFTGGPLGLYRVLWTTNLTDAVWNTLTNNVPGNSNGLAPLSVTDPGAAGQAARFYRVRTPP